MSDISEIKPLGYRQGKYLPAVLPLQSQTIKFIYFTILDKKLEFEGRSGGIRGKPSCLASASLGLTVG